MVFNLPQPKPIRTWGQELAVADAPAPEQVKYEPVQRRLRTATESLSVVESDPLPTTTHTKGLS